MKLAPIDHGEALDCLAQFVCDVHNSGFHKGIEFVASEVQDMTKINMVVTDVVGELYDKESVLISNELINKLVHECIRRLGFGPPQDLDEPAYTEV